MYMSCISNKKINLGRSKYSVEKKLLNIKEICEYLGIGETKARELVRGHHGFGVQIGNRWYADKKQLDCWIDENRS